MPKVGASALYLIGDNEGRIPLGEGLGIKRTHTLRLNDVRESDDGGLELPADQAKKLSGLTFNGTIVLSCHSNLKNLVSFGGHHPTAAADGARFAAFLNRYFAPREAGDQAITTVVVLACQIGRGEFLGKLKDGVKQAAPPEVYGANFICNRVGGPSVDFKYYYYGADAARTNAAANTVRRKSAAKGVAGRPAVFGGKAVSSAMLAEACLTMCDAPTEGRNAGKQWPMMAKL
jgi:hypothetical protein